MTGFRVKPIMKTLRATDVAATIVRLGLVVLLTMLAAPLSVDAQSRENARRIGFLSGGSSANFASLIEAFREGLRELGWIEGQNVTSHATSNSLEPIYAG